MSEAQGSSLTRRDFLNYLAATGVIVSSGGLLGGCAPISDISFPQMSGPLVLEGDASKPWWMRGNYAPVEDEVESFDLEVLGSIPPELNGFFLRNGPNPYSGDSFFWLLGDGMLHGVEIANGKALSYRNRWIQHSALGTEANALTVNPGNTALVHHSGKLLALYEMGPPHSIELSSLMTEGLYRFQDNSLSGPMAAHPKRDPKTGELFFIGYAPVAPYLRFHTVNPAGELVRTEEIELPRGVMMHDFQLTENYAVFFDLPMVFNVETPEFPIEFVREHGGRIGIMPRTGTNADLKWFDIDTCYLFHTINAYEDGAGKVVIEGCRIESYWENGFDSNESLPTASPWSWIVDLESGKVSEGQIIDDYFMDFPSIDHRAQGRENRFNYGMQLVPQSADYPMHPEGVLKHDRSTGSVEIWDTGISVQPDEAIFVPHPSETAEDAGWLLSMVYNRVEDCSELVILDASDVPGGPIARVKMPRRVPFGFHGLWVPSVG